MLSFVVGLTQGFMITQLIAVLLLPVSVYRFARLWVDERASSYAALFSVFAGSVVFLVYRRGQLPTMTSAPLYLLALPYFYHWSRSGTGTALLKGVVRDTCSSLCPPRHSILWLLLVCRPGALAGMEGSTRGGRGFSRGFRSRCSICRYRRHRGGDCVLPYWISIIQHPIEQTPIPHPSRANFLINPIYGMNYFVVPYGMMILALPFIVVRGSAIARLRPLCRILDYLSD